jgi:hypothetical protein
MKKDLTMDKMLSASWDQLEKLGLVKLTWEFDEVPYDTSFIDTWDDLTREQKDEENMAILAMVRDKGVYGRCPYYRLPWSTNWESITPVWGLIGEDTSYDNDLKMDTLTTIREQLEQIKEFCSR